MNATVLACIALALLVVLRRHSGASSRLGRALGSGLGGVAIFSGLALPLGPSDREVRRQPWVTYGIVGACVLVFLLQQWYEPGAEWRVRLRSAQSSAIDYAVEHPYLALPPALDEFWGDAVRRAMAERPRIVPESSAVVAAEQAELERRVDNLLATLDGDPVRRFSQVPARGGWLTFFTSLFLHGGWLHLVGNMLFLVLSGAFVEDVLGRVLFALLYVASGLVGNWASYAADPGSHVASLGASGAIAGVQGAFLVRFATRRLDFVSVPALWLPLLRARVSVPAYLYLLPWLGANVVALRQGVPGIGWRAHIAGFLFGMLVAALVRLSLLEERFIHPRIEARISLRHHPAAGHVFAQRMAGRAEAAQRTAARALREAPDDLGLLREAYDSAVAAGDPAAAGAYAARVVDRLLAFRDRDSVREGLRFIREVDAALDGAPHPVFWWSAALYLEARGERAQAMLFYEKTAAGEDRRLARQAAVRQEALRREVTRGRA